MDHNDTHGKAPRSTVGGKPDPAANKKIERLETVVNANFKPAPDRTDKSNRAEPGAPKTNSPAQP